MREIIFRGKRVDGYGWIEGDLIHDEAENNRPRIVIGREYSTGTFFNALAPRVISETVGQFTGLYDKNNKKIFEGDILINTLGDLFIIEFPAPNEDSEDYRNKPLYPMPWKEYREIIGNIYDNPELLGVEENEP